MTVNVTPTLLLGRGKPLLPAHIAHSVEEAVEIIRGGHRAQVFSNSTAYETLVALGATDEEAVSLIGYALNGVEKPELPKPYEEKSDAQPRTRKLYHITDSVDFELDPSYHPENNTTLGGDWPHTGIFLSNNPERWLNGYNYWRPYVVEFEVPEGVGADYSGETFIGSEDFENITLSRVLPLDGYCREEFHEVGWIEGDLRVDSFTGEPLTEIRGGYPVRHFPREWRSPDAREMSPEWRAGWEGKVARHLAAKLGDEHDGDGDGFIDDGTPFERPAIKAFDPAQPRDPMGRWLRLFHYSPSGNRESIESDGLLTRHPDGSSLAADDGEPEGVYFFGDQDQAMMLDDGDVFEVLMRPEEVLQDPFHAGDPSIVFSPKPVPPERIRHIASV